MAERPGVSPVEDAQAYIAGDRRRALAAGLPMADRVSGSAIFADISGFTPLTEALAAELGSQRGAEELGAVLNVVYDALLGELHMHGGSVLYFSGDAVTCWLDGDNGVLGVNCGLAMQRAMARVGTIITPAGTTIQLGMKVAVAAGRARRFVVGDPAIQLIDVLAGALMDRLAGAEHHAERGEVVVDAATLGALGDALEVVRVRGQGPNGVGVVGALRVPPPHLPEPSPYPRLPREVVRPWLLPAVYERLRTGRGEFLSELRPAVPMFVRFGGINYDEDPEAHRLLDHFIVQAQEVIDGYGGNLLQLTIGDKGAYLHAVFGSPLAHEDDAARACAAALDILGLEAGTAATGLQVGLSSGRVRSGAYGHSHRRAFSCLGDPVNLAARLMSAAPPGGIYVTARVARDAGSSFRFEELADLTVKGKSAPVAARRLTSRSGVGFHRQRRPVRPLIGRQDELAQLLALAGAAEGGKGKIAALVAEAGMGKSRLVEELVERLGERGTEVFSGAAASVGSAASYLIWQPIWLSLFGLTDDGDHRQLERALEEIDPSLLPRLPLLGAVLGVAIEDNDLTRTLDAKLRKSSLESLLLRYLTLRGAQQPLVLVLEDCHWVDALSAELLEAVCRAIAALPVLVVLTYRPGSFKAPGLPHATVIELDRLDSASCRQLVDSRLVELFGPETSPSEAFLQALMERAEGNAFYLEELVNYLHAQDADLSKDPTGASLELPENLAALVLSRIDALAEPPRRVLKVASVVGREFAVPMLMGAHPRLGGPRNVAGHLRRLCAHDLVVHEETTAEAYAFKHAVIHETAYNSLPYALRARLHGTVGAWLEANDPLAIDLLAHHFWHSADEVKKREYLLRAGEAAQARYANEAAIDYYRRLTSLLPVAEQGSVFLKIASVLELRSDWADAEAAYGEALELGETTGDHGVAAWARTGRATPLRRQARYEEAVADLEAAALAFQEAGDVAGLGQVAYVRGIIAYQRSNPAEAWEHLQLSLELRRAIGDRRAEAAVLDNLAIAAAYREHYDGAMDLGQQALELRTALGDRWAVGLSHANVGVLCFLRKDYLAAKAHFEDALAIQLEAGDTYSIANARDNLGNVAREMGEVAAAQSHYAAALRMYQAIGDRRGLFMLYEEIAMLSIATEPVAAFQLIGAADGLRDSLGSPRLGSEAAELEDHVGEARHLLGNQAAEAQRAGGALAAEEVRSLALGLCGEENAEARRSRGSDDRVI